MEQPTSASAPCPVNQGERTQFAENLLHLKKSYAVSLYAPLGALVRFQKQAHGVWKITQGQHPKNIFNRPVNQRERTKIAENLYSP